MARIAFWSNDFNPIQIQKNFTKFDRIGAMVIYLAIAPDGLSNAETIQEAAAIQKVSANHNLNHWRLFPIAARPLDYEFKLEKVKMTAYDMDNLTAIILLAAPILISIAAGIVLRISKGRKQ